MQGATRSARPWNLGEDGSMKRECSTSLILALLLAAGSFFPLSADAQRIRPSIIVGAGSGSVTYA